MTKDQDMFIRGKGHCSMWVVMDQYPHGHRVKGYRMMRN
jgi:hypothetical protein